MDSLFLEISVGACHKDRTYKQTSWNLNSRDISKTYRHIFFSFYFLFAPCYYQLLLFYLYVVHDKRYVFHKITYLDIITRTLVPIFTLQSSTTRAVRVQLAVQGPWCQIAEDILVAMTNCLLVGCAECCSGSIRVVYVSVTWLGCFSLRWFYPTPFSVSSMHFSDLPLLLSEWGL